MILVYDRSSLANKNGLVSDIVPEEGQDLLSMASLVLFRRRSWAPYKKFVML
jgi:hypothetical protein